MTKRKKSFPSRAKSSPTLPTGVVPTQRAAAKALSTTTKTLRAWRSEGAPGFNADGSINLTELAKWVEARQKERGDSLNFKEQKTLEEIRKLRLANDQKEGRLVERAWVAARIQRMFGDLNGFRAKSEAEDAVKFAQTGGDMAKSRVILQGIWDHIAADLQSLHHHLKEGDARG
jgi:hypothetical protein